jgi:hypothetical protein
MSRLRFLHEIISATNEMTSATIEIQSFGSIETFIRIDSLRAPGFSIATGY